MDVKPSGVFSQPTTFWPCVFFCIYDLHIICSISFTLSMCVHVKNTLLCESILPLLHQTDISAQSHLALLFGRWFLHLPYVWTALPAEQLTHGGNPPCQQCRRWNFVLDCYQYQNWTTGMEPFLVITSKSTKHPFENLLAQSDRHGSSQWNKSGR